MAIAASGDQLIIGNEAIIRVPLAGGAPVTLATPQSPSGLVVLNGVAYFSASQAVGSPDPQGKQPSQSVLESVPVSGGEPTILPGPLLEFSPGSATDETSIYADTYQRATIGKLTPPATTPVDMALDGKIMTDAIAVQGDYLYVAGQDFAVSGRNNGVIERLPKKGGKAERIVSAIGHPWHLVADEDGLYWSQDAVGFGNGTVVRSALDGSSASTLVATNGFSLAVAYGRLYFSTGAEIQSTSTGGGDITTVATGLAGAGMLVVAGGNLVWVDPATRSLSDTTVPKVMTACMP